MKATANALAARLVFVCVTITAFSVVWFPDLSLGQVPEEQQTVVKSISVRYIGPPTVDKERILSAMATKVGDDYSASKAQDDVNSIYLQGDVETVNILEEPPGSGNLVVEVVTRAVLADVIFINNSMVTSDTLRKKVGLKIGDSIDGQKLAEGQNKIEAYYNERGFPDVTVTHAVKETERPGFSEVIYNVEEGLKSLVRNIRFEGNTIFSNAELRKQLKTKKKGLFSWITNSGTINRDDLDDDRERIVNHYRNAGHLYADVVQMRQERFSDSKVDIVMVIEEGTKYTVSSVALNGIKAFDEAELRPALELKAGDAYSQKSVRADELILRRYYGSRGYADVRISTNIRETGANSISITYNVVEGSPYRIRKVNFEGHDSKDKVLRREASVAPGDPYNTVEIEATQARLMGTKYFKSVDYLPAGTEEPGFKDVNFSVVEDQTGRVTFGASFSSIDNLVGFVNLRQTNFDINDYPRFKGAGQRFNFGLKVGTERRDFDIGFTEPWFMDQKLALGGRLFYRENFFLSDRYDERDVGGAIHMRKEVGEHSFISAEYLLQEVTIDDFSTDASDTLRMEEGSFIQSALNFSYSLDTRDSQFLARSGHRFTTGVGLSGLGGDVETYSLNASGAKHWLLPYDTIFTVKGGIEVVDSWGSGDRVPIFERLFLGGSNNLRGFDYRDVSPKDETGEPLGGGTAFNMTAEYTFPLIENIRGAVFGDLGFVNADSWDFSGSDLNSDVGVGVRIELPGVGPVRLDYGIPIESDRFNDSGGKFNFYLGYEFN